MTSKSRKAPEPKKPTPKAPASRPPPKTGPVKKAPVAKAPVKPLASKPVKVTQPVKVTKPVAVKPKVLQNFTVASPPAQRKNPPDEAELSPPVSRERKMTRTLDPSESFLANLSLINSSRLNVGPPEARAASPTEVKPPIVVAKPISFEIPLDVKPPSPTPPVDVEDDDDYDDDFESYESDFEDCPTSEEEEEAEEEEQTTPTSSSTTPPASVSKSSSSSHPKQPVVDFKLTSPARADQFQTRGEAILSKITLDDLTYSLLELPPMAVTFGHSHSSMQVHCQTDSWVVDKMVETEAYGRSTKWTQTQVTDAVGEVLEEGSQLEKEGDDIFEASLDLCAKAHRKYGDNRFVERQHVDPLKLERFLRRGYFVIKQLQNSQNRFSQPSALPMAQGKATIKVEDFEDLKGSKMTSISVFNGTLVTVHEQADARSFIALWDLSGCHQLACCVSWTPINCVNLANLHTLIAGSADGSLVLWDPLDEAAHSRIPPSQILHLSDDFLASYGIVQTIKCSKSPRLKVHCLHDNNYLTVWILLKSGSTETVTTAITCDLGYVAPACHQRLTYVSGVSLNDCDARPGSAKSRFSKVLHCFDNDILQDQVLQKLITSETAAGPVDADRRYLVTDLMVEGKTVSLITDQNFLFNGFSSSSGKKTKVWLGREKLDLIETFSVDNNGLIVTGMTGSSTINFQANGETIEKQLHPSMGRLVRSTPILQTNGDYIFRIAGQELTCYAKNGKTSSFSMKNCVNLKLWRRNASESLLVLQLSNGQIEVHRCRNG